jgi:hypothetical protein
VLEPLLCVACAPNPCVPSFGCVGLWCFSRQDVGFRRSRVSWFCGVRCASVSVARVERCISYTATADRQDTYIHFWREITAASVGMLQMWFGRAYVHVTVAADATYVCERA